MASVHQRYRILEKIDAGGMAEIYKAASVSMDGFERAVAIKRILPHLTQDQKFITMFLDEARLSMQLNHANIVQIIDLGKVGETYFMAMELVDGANLRKIMQKAVDTLTAIPINVACFIAIEIAKGLAYAHEKTDVSGHSLGIVHRDVSPPNILMSRQGEVKVTDFGLAKAKSNVSASEVDVVKGKFAYLCPEVVEGKDPDARADIYAIGIILWEMLCGRRLFVAKTDMDTVELVRKGEIPKAGALRSEVDEDLEKILQRALAKNVKRRYQTCRELEKDLADYLAKKGMRATSADLAAFMREQLDSSQAPETIDVSALLHVEMDELARVGQLDLTVGQVPLRPSDLRARSVSKLDIGSMLDRVDAQELDALAPSAGGLAEQLQTGTQKGAAKGNSQATPKWVVPATIVTVVILLAIAWLAFGKK